MFTNIERPLHHRFARPAENIAILSESVAQVKMFSGIRTILRLIMAYFAVRSTPISNHSSQPTIHNVVDTWNGSLNNRRWTAIFRTIFSSAIKHISHSVGMLINKIVVFGVLTILKKWRQSRKSHCLVRSLAWRYDCLRYRPICVKNWSKITSKKSMLATLRVDVI